MTQEQINVVLALMPFIIPIVQFLLQKFFSRNKDSTEYSGDLLELLNKTTDALKKSREDLARSEAEYEKTVEALRQGSDANLEALRVELNARINRQKARIEDLESINKIYTITFDLVTHPYLEIRNPKVKIMDDVSASQKAKAITEEQIEKHKNEPKV